MIVVKIKWFFGGLCDTLVEISMVRTRGSHLGGFTVYVVVCSTKYLGDGPWELPASPPG